MSTALAILSRIWACEGMRDAPTVVPRTIAVVEPNLAFYRKYTEAMLRRYMRFSLEAGRAPSMLGQEMFRSKVTSCRVRSFEDVVIYVHDMEKCLGKLTRTQQLLITRIAVQEYTHGETAAMLGTNRRTIIRRYDEAVDRLTAILLEVHLLEPQKACQEGGR